jgi:outer membrane protein TolC
VEGWLIANVARALVRAVSRLFSTRLAPSLLLGGQVGFLPILDGQRQLFAAEDAQVMSSLAKCLAAISLYKAMGGGRCWDGVALPDYAPGPAQVARK